MDLSTAETLNEKGVSTLQAQGSAPPAADKMARTDSTASGGAPRIPEELSILPGRGFVLFPGAILPLTVSRAASIKLLDETLPITKKRLPHRRTLPMLDVIDDPPLAALLCLCFGSKNRAISIVSS